MPAVWNTQYEDYPVPPPERWVHRTQFQDKLTRLSSNCQPASQPASQPTSERKMSGRGSNHREQVPCPKCGSQLQRWYTWYKLCVRPVVSPSAMRQRGPETEESGDDGYGGSRDEQGQREEQHNPVVQPTSGQERDRANQGGMRPAREPAMGTEPSPDFTLAILNGLDILSLPALRHLSMGASTRTGPSTPEIRLETTRDGGNAARRQRPQAARRCPPWEPRR